MRYTALSALFVSGTLLVQSPAAPAPGQMLITSTPSGLNVYVEKHKEAPKQNLTRTGNIEEKPDGVTPFLLDADPGHYTISVERIFNADDPEAPQAPRGCVNNFSFSGGVIFWQCFKCRSYPDEKPEMRDDIDPYRRDGNLGVCFHAPDKADTPIKYYRTYAVVKGAEAFRLEAKFERAVR